MKIDDCDVRAIGRMAIAWHTVSDHAKDGGKYGSMLCNCAHIARRAYLELGWRDDD